jgi:hypothetical protein
MERSLRALLDDRVTHLRMATAARSAALGRFRLEPIVDRYEALYARVVKERK